MSYCFATQTLEFGRAGEPSMRVIERIRGFVESKASCLTVAAPCSSGASPTNVTIGAQGGQAIINVTGDASCPWLAKSNSPFLKLIGMSLGTGPGPVDYESSRIRAPPGRER
jgi:hypothetical protein